MAMFCKLLSFIDFKIFFAILSIPLLTPIPTLLSYRKNNLPLGHRAFSRVVVVCEGYFLNWDKLSLLNLWTEVPGGEALTGVSSCCYSFSSVPAVETLLTAR